MYFMQVSKSALCSWFDNWILWFFLILQIQKCASMYF